MMQSMGRYLFYWVILVFGLASADAEDTKDSTDEVKPNFIFVLSDDVAQGDLGCYDRN